MVRIAATGDRIEVDPTQRLSGRGGYLHRRRDCL